MSRAALFLFLLTCVSASQAGPIYEQFGAGALGVPWNSSIDAVIGSLQPGDHVFATTPGHRAYWVKDDQTLWGVPRQGHGILYGFGEKNELVSAAISFPYERKEQLLGTLIYLFGASERDGTKGSQRWYQWQCDGGVKISVWTSAKSAHGVLWFAMEGPNGKQGRLRCL